MAPALEPRKIDDDTRFILYMTMPYAAMYTLWVVGFPLIAWIEHLNRRTQNDYADPCCFPSWMETVVWSVVSPWVALFKIEEATAPLATGEVEMVNNARHSGDTESLATHTYAAVSTSQAETPENGSYGPQMAAPPPYAN
ncbi:hypothetical protein BDZ90DRAFT_261070 [Jaminaea rosea]|uniref:Uncharacterized protein n=1 Tax=Jaminaea rosea TaxID=1569628 RepID=A0A316UPV7_9BASI|nr:hypothetical protein BDZ90DRAFT_261070 [Jaminaea rosea]PWN26818.1 hypothetical protein BDZ90DRAFT_261070 [Jaminaea rosea]